MFHYPHARIHFKLPSTAKIKTIHWQTKGCRRKESNTSKAYKL